ncbi:UvrD-helicase domain-containing protein [Vibrio parahaemolyticus]|nr:hypothetical protein [Vibrio parahaemolyticus]EGR2871332.1 hypothetical protein [Vibrio parahaemolyticus]EJC7063671.1 UvrD-helicase domain-containing protein [Vibrio parahaemolyticus]EJF9992612.1 UvrD-helicase domain-containing protein [Vibrio parahaemolyticus]EJG0196768.1 UvrD-helicase domain-containing protein [Vibrio parahaemolyticus]
MLATIKKLFRRDLSIEKNNISKSKPLSWTEKGYHAVLALRTPRQLTLTDDILTYSCSKSSETVNLCTVLRTSYSQTWLLKLLNTGVIKLHTNKSDSPCILLFRCDWNDQVKIIEAVDKAAYELALSEKKHIESVIRALQKETENKFNTLTYISGSKFYHFVEKLKQQYDFDALLHVERVYRNKYLKLPEDEISDAIQQSEYLQTTLKPNSQRWRSVNLETMKKQSIDNANFFKNVESSKLTPKQTLAALVFDDANIVVAAAGSGKTSVIVAKAGFAITSGFAKASEILAIAYNSGAAHELAERIPDRLSKLLPKSNVKVKARTFHALGYKYLLENSGKNPPKPISFEPNSDDDGEGVRFFNHVFDDLRDNDSEFATALTEWIAYARYPEPKLDPDLDSSIEENEKRYQKACANQVRKKKENSTNRYGKNMPTLDPTKFVRSLEEAKIFNWLYLRGGEFEYEKALWKPLNELMNIAPSPYCPDFVFPDKASPLKFVVYEHFGIGKDGKAPSFLGGQKYVNYANSKRTALKQVLGEEYNKFFMETRSGQFQDGTIFNEIERSLKSRGIKLTEPSIERMRKALSTYDDYDAVRELFAKFISTFRDSGISQPELLSKAKSSPEPDRAIRFLKALFPLLKKIESELKSKNLIEFSDMLSQAITHLRTTDKKEPYKLILVDEFQDTARLKIQLVRELAKRSNGECVLFFVGDDWQAINRFSGSDISIFQDYISYDNRLLNEGVHKGSADNNYRSTHVVQLPETFRYPQGIGLVARESILINKDQIKKPVKSALLPNTKDTIRIVEHSDSAEARLGALKKELDTIAGRPFDTQKKGEDKRHTVFILTRNRTGKTPPDGMQDTDLKLIISQYHSRLKINIKSMHRSKGLEADYTIIGGMDSGYKGFPTVRENDPLMDLILPPSSSPVDEERRLFYVALTRSKIQTILLTAATRPSMFIQEFEKMHELKDCFDWEKSNEKRHKCPKCSYGSLISYYGKLQCTGYPKCGHSISTKKSS